MMIKMLDEKKIGVVSENEEKLRRPV